MYVHVHAHIALLSVLYIYMYEKREQFNTGYVDNCGDENQFLCTSFIIMYSTCVSRYSVFLYTV